MINIEIEDSYDAEIILDVIYEHYHKVCNHSVTYGKENDEYIKEMLTKIIKQFPDQRYIIKK